MTAGPKNREWKKSPPSAETASNRPNMIIPPTNEANRGFFPLNSNDCDAAMPKTKIVITTKASGGAPSVFKTANRTANAVTGIIIVPMPNRRGTPTGLRFARNGDWPIAATGGTSAAHPTGATSPIGARRRRRACENRPFRCRILGTAASLRLPRTLGPHHVPTLSSATAPAATATRPTLGSRQRGQSHFRRHENWDSPQKIGTVPRFGKTPHPGTVGQM